MKDVNDYLLTRTVKVGTLKRWMNDKDESSKTEIIILIYHRFNNRYIMHLKRINSGFLKLAVSCLMIETLESFKQGAKDTKGKSGKMFKDFFQSEEAFFPGFKDIDFYSDIRCGILHQAETKNAWRVLLDDTPIIDKKKRTINSKKFVFALEGSLGKYIETLKSNGFESQIWKYALLKLDDICENCKLKDHSFDDLVRN
jgi:hypothetical protein